MAQGGVVCTGCASFEPHCWERAVRESLEYQILRRQKMECGTSETNYFSKLTILLL